MDVSSWTILIFGLSFLTFILTCIFVNCCIGTFHSCHYRHLIPDPAFSAPGFIQSVSVKGNHKVIIPDAEESETVLSSGVSVNTKQQATVAADTGAEYIEPSDQSDQGSNYQEITPRSSTCRVNIQEQKVSYFPKSETAANIISDKSNNIWKNSKNQNYSSFVHL